MKSRPHTSSRSARWQGMAEHIVRQGSVSVTELAESFGVSVMTVHRDLDELERQGMVRKVRGGATAQASNVWESNIAYRLKAHTAEKDAIARVVAGMIEPGSSVMLDDSTTALAVARQLQELAPLTVVTNFLEAIRLLAGHPDIRLIALGGEYHATHDSFLGLGCVDAVEAVSTDVVVVSTSAISEKYAFHQEQEIVLVKRAMLGSGTRRILAVDGSKLARVALHRVAPLDDFHVVVVDANAPADLLQRLRDHHAHVEVAQL
ncbi:MULTISPECIES: DeoR/GlpR family DNA-binding transcription regulator [Nonomuraea]|uniref:DeoR/GlpR family DNA-binding transcription regulator n=1 Tax=Nonomuraea ferruginea TaxID=46174 RepID=A0ABT4T7X5_9ACTN|nr:DeoR/GlpR family DNA-binding transcription regulator [Nonomuraea ferruginea]MDA0645606.1 DeoR/GlpR family DNA-binding transcription regulator [Nonomuraea ferruginea]